MICRHGVAVLPPRLFPEAAYYALLSAYGHVCIDIDMRFDKRAKSVHRYAVADTRGRLELTVPVVRPAGATAPAGVPWSAVGVSGHGRWWEVHFTALESAYGRTPFFEHYVSRLEPLFVPRPVDGESVGGIVRAADICVRAILGLETDVEYSAGVGTDDYRRNMPLAPEVQYWQVRGDSLGFIPGLSILDAIFNLGPETPLLLRDIQRYMGLR